jgi:DNA-binding NarL/FixJ family response regulator
LGDNNLQMPIRVFLLVQNRLLRDALERLLRKRSDLQVVACTKEGECTPQSILASECDVLVLDFLDTHWLPAEIQLSTGACSPPKSLLICMADDSDQFIAAVHGGAIGYLLKEASIDDVISAVRAVFRGEAICPPKLCAELFHSLTHVATEAVSTSSHNGRPPLTLRQQRLAAMVAQGLSNKEIAAQLNLSEFTVKNHLRRIMKRFGAKSRTQAVDAILSYGYVLANKSTMQLNS